MWKYEKYVQQGLSHIEGAIVCQDSVEIKEDDNCIVAALADGLGSLKYSEIAAKTVTQSVCELLQDYSSSFTPEVLTDEEYTHGIADWLIQELQSRLAKQAEKDNISLRDMDCTLVFVCISKKYNYALIGRLGDSAVCIIKSSNSEAINDSGQSANSTCAVLDKDAHNSLKLFMVDLNGDDIKGFILTSDGLEGELYTKGSSHVSKSAEKYFNAVSIGKNAIGDISAYITKLTKCENSQFDDDISIAVLSRIDATVNLPPDPTWLCRCGNRNVLQSTYCKKCNADFTVLYKGIALKKYGGKAAFFSKLNSVPGAENELLRISDSPEAKNNFLKSLFDIPTDSIQSNNKQRNLISLNGDNKRDNSQNNAIGKANQSTGLQKPNVRENDPVHIAYQGNQINNISGNSNSPNTNIKRDYLQNSAIENTNQSASLQKPRVRENEPLHTAHPNSQNENKDNRNEMNKRVERKPQEIANQTPKDKPNSQVNMSNNVKISSKKSNKRVLVVLACLAFLAIGIMFGSLFTKRLINRDISELEKKIDDLSDLNGQQYNTKKLEQKIEELASALEQSNNHEKLDQKIDDLTSEMKKELEDLRHSLESLAEDKTNDTKNNDDKDKDKSDKDDKNNETKNTVTARVTKSKADVKKEASNGSVTVASLKRNASITAYINKTKTVNNQEWIQVKTEDGIIGWMLSDLLDWDR